MPTLRPNYRWFHLPLGLIAAVLVSGNTLATEPPQGRATSPLPSDKTLPDQNLLPTFVDADQVTGLNDVETVAEGNVVLRKAESMLTADRLVYRQKEDEVDATGNVRLSQNNDLITGPRLRLKIADNIGFFESPQYTIKRAPPGTPAAQVTVGSGEAKRLDFEGKNHYRLTDATYSTCGPTDPDWYARAGSMVLDYDREIGDAHHTTLVFQGVPLLYSPWLTFSLNNQRKSGLLAPTLGTTSKSGLEMTVPYYWAIAPNLDATLAPRVMSKRGVALDGEFRYLEPNYSGIFQGELLPNDTVSGARRSSYTLAHNQNFGLGFSGSLNLNGVSDDTYFTDLSPRMTNTAQTNLLRQGVFSYASTWWNASLMAQNFQTLQDPALPPVAIPYRRLPQLTLNAARADMPLGGLFALRGEFVHFAHPTQLEGTRSTVNPQISLPIQSAAFFLTPKLALHSTTYHLQDQPAGTPDRLTRNVPLFSLDGGVVFERPLAAFGRELTQTLEPRFYYLRVPTRTQDQIPVFDSGMADFNFAQIFSENRYSGGDRIGDANQLTAAITSRLIDPANGAELLRGAIGQRFYFKNQEVTLPGETPRTSNMADFLASLTGEVRPGISLDSGLQYNPHDHQLRRFTLSGRYRPEAGRSLSASYRYNRDLINTSSSGSNHIRQIDLAGQWPLWGQWSGVGRYNYSLIDRRIIEGIGGLEYNGGCWLSRVVLQRLATATGDSSTAFFIQLELNGFSSIGSNPMDLLKRSIPGFSRTNQSVAEPNLTLH
ncbi:MAG: LPS-assembly protein LptD [Sterolibacterium sp.]|jgi:LPS-assembly protein|nr:LPS-assembly protein LptD [Sterolibacterium sp.]